MKSPPRLTFIVHENGAETARVPLRAEPMLIGRRPDADVRVADPAMSFAHAKVTPAASGAGPRLTDLGSKNGTYLNGRRVREAELRAGDEIEVGLATILLSYAPAHEPPAAPTPAALPPAALQLGARLERLSQSKIMIPLETLRGGPRAEDGAPRDQRLLILRDFSESLRGADRPARIFAMTRKVLGKAFPGARVFVLLPGEKETWRDPVEPALERPPSDTVAGEAVASRSAILLVGLGADARFSAAESVQAGGIETAIAAPLFCEEDAVAVLYADAAGPDAFGDADLELLGIAANHVSAVLANAANIAGLHRTNEELAAAHAKLEEWARELERRVDERTAELRRQADEIKALADERDDLLRMAAHDIRNPLSIIQVAAELLHTRAQELGGRSLEEIDALRQGVGEIVPLLTGLLDAKAIEAGKLELDLAPRPLQPILDHALRLTALAASARGIEVALEVAPDLKAEADPQRLTQVIANLLFNALKFSKDGGRVVVAAR